MGLTLGPFRLEDPSDRELSDLRRAAQEWQNYVDQSDETGCLASGRLRRALRWTATLEHCNRHPETWPKLWSLSDLSPLPTSHRGVRSSSANQSLPATVVKTV